MIIITASTYSCIVIVLYETAFKKERKLSKGKVELLVLLKIMNGVLLQESLVIRYWKM